MSGVPIAQLYGALYFASVLSTTLYSMTCMQTFFYYVHFREEPAYVQSFVATVWALNTIHEALIVSAAYKYIMAGMAVPTSFSDLSPEIVLETVFTGLVATSTQGFFVYRLYSFGKKNTWAPILWLPLAIWQIVSGYITIAKALDTVDGMVTVHFATLTGPFLTAVTASCVSIAAVVDVLIAVFFTWLYARERIGSPTLRSTVQLLQRLTMLAVCSGIWTATFAVLATIMMYVFPSSLLQAVFLVPLCSLYCNTLLANLNVRAYIRGEMWAYDVGATRPGVLESTSSARVENRGP